MNLLVCDWLRSKMLNSYYSIDADEVSAHVKECQLCQQLFCLRV